MKEIVIGWVEINNQRKPKETNIFIELLRRILE